MAQDLPTSGENGETKAPRERLRSRTRPHSRQLRKLESRNQERQGGESQHIQTRPPTKQPLCVVSLSFSKGAHERVEEAAGHGEREELSARLAECPDSRTVLSISPSSSFQEKYLDKPTRCHSIIEIALLFSATTLPTRGPPTGTKGSRHPTEIWPEAEDAFPT